MLANIEKKAFKNFHYEEIIYVKVDNRSFIAFYSDRFLNDKYKMFPGICLFDRDEQRFVSTPYVYTKYMYKPSPSRYDLSMPKNEALKILKSFETSTSYEEFINCLPEKHRFLLNENGFSEHFSLIFASFLYNHYQEIDSNILDSFYSQYENIINEFESIQDQELTFFSEEAQQNLWEIFKGGLINDKFFTWANEENRLSMLKHVFDYPNVWDVKMNGRNELTFEDMLETKGNISLDEKWKNHCSEDGRASEIISLCYDRAIQTFCLENNCKIEFSGRQNGHLHLTGLTEFPHLSFSDNTTDLNILNLPIEELKNFVKTMDNLETDIENRLKLVKNELVNYRELDFEEQYTHAFQALLDEEKSMGLL